MELTKNQIDEATRFVAFLEKAKETFGSEDKATRWLHRPTTVLDGRTPAEELATQDGALRVAVLLTKIDNGIASDVSR